MTAQEAAVDIEAGGDRMVGILHRANGDIEKRTGVVIIVGGPQYRVGSHRQFVLLARDLADSGFPVLRFDYRGMGDSEGEERKFTDIDADIRAAIAAFLEHSDVDQIVLWGLCDAASAAIYFAQRESRIAAMILLNPWVHSEATEAKVRLRSYYVTRLRNAEFWRKITRFEFSFRNSAQSLLRFIRNAYSRPHSNSSELNFIDRMRQGLEAYRGKVFLILSGDDMTAAEFKQLCRENSAWQKIAKENITETCEIAEANHTFARAQWRGTVSTTTIRWLCDVDNMI